MKIPTGFWKEVGKYFISFLPAGAGHYGIFWILMYNKVPYLVASMWGFVLASLVIFPVLKRWVFVNEDKINKEEALEFTAVTFVYFVLYHSLLPVFVEFVGLGELYAAPAVTKLVLQIPKFFVLRIVFKKTRGENRE